MSVCSVHHFCNSWVYLVSLLITMTGSLKWAPHLEKPLGASGNTRILIRQNFFHLCITMMSQKHYNVKMNGASQMLEFSSVKVAFCIFFPLFPLHGQQCGQTTRNISPPILPVHAAHYMTRLGYCKSKHKGGVQLNVVLNVLALQ